MLAIAQAKSLSKGDDVSIAHPHLRALASEAADAASRAAEEMRLLLSTGKVKKSSALQEWSEELQNGVTLHFATCMSHLLGVHGLPGTNVDRAFTTARTRAVSLLHALAENSTANSAALLMHGMIASSSPALYAVRVHGLHTEGGSDGGVGGGGTKALLPALIECLAHEGRC